MQKLLTRQFSISFNEKQELHQKCVTEVKIRDNTPFLCSSPHSLHGTMAPSGSHMVPFQ